MGSAQTASIRLNAKTIKLLLETLERIALLLLSRLLFAGDGEFAHVRGDIAVRRNRYVKTQLEVEVGIRTVRFEAAVKILRVFDR